MSFIVVVLSMVSSAYAGAGAPEPTAATTPTSRQPGTPDSGIFGAMITAYGNQPSTAPPPTKCVRVFDSSGKNLIARGVCGGVYRAFRVPLTPGQYLVEIGSPRESRSGTEAGRRQLVTVLPNRWINLSSPAPSNPIP